jgi:glutathione peroxidase
MRTIIIILLALFTLPVLAQSPNGLHQFTVDDIQGKPFDLAQLKGKKVLVVNTASKCGLTPQYKDLEALYQQYKDKNFIIIGFPANNFMKQEPGTNNEIADFCSDMGVTFPIMSKISVKGVDMHPLFLWLTQKDKNGKFDADVQWNFQKFMIDEEGNLVDFVSPRSKPNDPKIVSWLEN